MEIFIIVAVFWLSIPVINKVNQRKKQGWGNAPADRQQRRQTPAARTPARPAPRQIPEPTYGEGEDPCHEAQLAVPAIAPSYQPFAGEGSPETVSERVAREEDAARAGGRPVTIPGLGLSFDADAVVKGVIFSEILSRKPVRRPH